MLTPTPALLTRTCMETMRRVYVDGQSRLATVAMLMVADNNNYGTDYKL